MLSSCKQLLNNETCQCCIYPSYKLNWRNLVNFKKSKIFVKNSCGWVGQAPTLIFFFFFTCFRWQWQSCGIWTIQFFLWFFFFSTWPRDPFKAYLWFYQVRVQPFINGRSFKNDSTLTLKALATHFGRVFINTRVLINGRPIWLVNCTFSP